MPGQTDNSNLLDGVNQIILTLNELVTVTNSQVLDVTVNPTNTFAPTFSPLNDIVNNFSPVNNNTVNFDTQSIVTELEHIKNNLLDMAGDTDALAHLERLIDMVTNMGTGNGLLGEIRDRLADDGDNIARAIRESKATITKTVDLGQKATVSDAIKCRNAKAYIGFISSELRLAQEWAAYKNSIVSNAADIFVEWYKGTIVATAEPTGLSEGVSHAGLVSLANIWQEFTIADFNTMVGEFEAVKEAFLCDVYEASTPNEAITNMRETIDLAFTSAILVFNGMDEILLSSSDMLARVFSNSLSSDELARYTLWSTSDCGTCTQPSSCGNKIISGTGSPFASGFIRYDEEIRMYGEYDENNIHWIDVQFDTPTEVTIIAQTDGASTDWTFYDCEGNICATETRTSQMNANMPFTVDCYRFSVSNAGPIDIKFTLAMGSLAPLGCGNVDVGYTYNLACLTGVGSQDYGTPAIFDGSGAWALGYDWTVLTSSIVTGYASDVQEIQFVMDAEHIIELEVLSVSPDMTSNTCYINDCDGYITDANGIFWGAIPLTTGYKGLFALRSLRFQATHSPGDGTIPTFTIKIRKVQ